VLAGIRALLLLGGGFILRMLWPALPEGTLGSRRLICKAGRLDENLKPASDT